MASPERILARVARTLGPASLSGQRVLLTGGPTREPLDPARYLTNPSSGLMANRLAAEAFRRGAEVTVICGPSRVSMPEEARVVPVETTDEMLKAVEEELTAQSYHFFLAVAAVADFRPSQLASQKLPTSEGSLYLSLQPTAKIVDRVKQLRPEIFLVSFKAEATDKVEDLVEAARRSARRSRADLVLANPVGRPGCGFDSSHNQLWAVSPEGEVVDLGTANKQVLAVRAWDRVQEIATSL